MARGESVRHVTIDNKQVLRGGALAALAGVLLSGLAFYAVPAPTEPGVPTESALRQNYETRLANLRTQLDEATSKQFVAQKMVESKVDVLLSQQEIIAERYERLEPIFERARENGILPEFTSFSTPIPTPRPNATHANASVVEERFEPPLTHVETDAANQSLRDQTQRVEAEDTPLNPAFLDPIETASLRQSTVDLSPDALSGFGRAIDFAELQQIANLKILTSEAIERSVMIASVLSSVGIDADTDMDSALGGPFEPVPDEAGFDTHFAELDIALDRLEGLRGISEALPFLAPMPAKLMSSRFGIRSDPFLRRRALHAGIDYAARSGTPITSTASGTVVRAGRSGGYGNLVEIDHGNGITTRFGHMSRVNVKAGDIIERGTTIGAVGSTGRSTGPHLHYEVRRDGKAIDPMRFIRAGRTIDDLS